MLTWKETPDSQEDVAHLLHPSVKDWFYSHYPDFSLPQLYGVKEIHSRKHILISAPTGATKTLTAFLSILNELVDASLKGRLEDRVYCVYVSPLKALNYDIEVNLLAPLREIEELVGNLGIRVGVRTGDTTTRERSRMLKEPPHILITTPESLAIMQTSPKFRSNLKQVEWCIVDEIHALAENKRGVHLALTLEVLSDISPHMTRVGLSATISPLQEVGKYLAGSRRECLVVDVQFLKELDMQVVSPLPDLIEVSHAKLHKALYDTLHSYIQKHRTTLIFTNTRAGTERVVHTLQERFPGAYAENIGAHHGSLSKDVRHNIEERLRQGSLKAVVSSTSLELGIDIGHIDLVIILGSPKSVARALQRVGRAGHKLHQKAKGRIVVTDRDDLLECSVLLKTALEKKIDDIHLPRNCLDVLSQQIVGIILQKQRHIYDLYRLVTRAYPYADLSYEDFMEVIRYLAGMHASLEDRHVYGKIAYYDDTGLVKRRGRLTRVIYMTNIGTIPDEPAVLVKVGNEVVGTLDEAFLERLKPGDVFVLGGQTYQFKHARGMVAQVTGSVDRPPTVPAWFSEMLPLSFDLAREIAKFRRLLTGYIVHGSSQDEIISFIRSHLYVDDVAARAIHAYVHEQYRYLGVPTDRQIIMESYNEDSRHYYIFHSMCGRRVHDCLSRGLAYAVSRLYRRDVEIGINDNGFYIASTRSLPIMKAFGVLKSEKLSLLLSAAIDKTEILKRRFRHTAARSFMILRNYKGQNKQAGKQQVSSQILINAVRRISQDFPILKEARREVMEDVMDIEKARRILEDIADEKIKVHEEHVHHPSPFAFNLFLQGFSDVLRADDRMAFLKRMHEQVLSRIEHNEAYEPGRYNLRRDIERMAQKRQLSAKQRRLLRHISRLGVSEDLSDALSSLVREEEVPRERLEEIKKKQQTILTNWPQELAYFVLKKAEEAFSYEAFWNEEEDKKRLEEEERKEEIKKDFVSAARKVGLEADIQHDVLSALDGGSQSISEKTREWIEGLTSGSVPKIWKDNVVKFLRSLL